MKFVYIVTLIVLLPILLVISIIMVPFMAFGAVAGFITNSLINFTNMVMDGLKKYE